VLAGIRAALAAGAVSADAVAIEARKAGPAITVSSPAAPPPRRSQTALVTLQARQQAHALRPDTRPEPSVAGYDELLARRTRRDAS
jgi:hypothetical protein